MRVSDFKDDLFLELPLVELRNKYDLSWVKELVQNEKFYDIGEGIGCIMVITAFRRNDAIECLKWILDECGVKISICVARCSFGFETGQMIFVQLLDWACLVQPHPDLRIINFLLDRGAKSCKSLDWILKAHSLIYPHLHVPLVKRLLDRGATCALLPVSYKTTCIQSLFQSRQAARAACCALLLVAKRREDLRGIIARELWREIAERVWAQRWNFNET